MTEKEKLKVQIRLLQYRFDTLVRDTDEEDEAGIEEIGMLENEIDRLITNYERMPRD